MLATHKVAVVDLLQLRHFQAVARHQHVSRAAAELRIAQPALSRSIATLCVCKHEYMTILVLDSMSEPS